MMVPTYPRSLAVCIDEADLDERYRMARLRLNAPQPASPGFWQRIFTWRKS